MSKDSDTLYKYDALYDNFYPVTIEEVIQQITIEEVIQQIGR